MSTGLGSECAICNTQYAHRDNVMVLDPCQALLNSTLNNKSTEKLSETSLGDNLCCGRPIFSLAINKDKHVNDQSLHHCNEFGINKKIKCERSGIVVRDVCPPFCDTKGSDNDCSDQDSAHILVAGRLKSSSLKRASKAN
ncbi:hypothetical protein L6164_034353 [Bauhinia variegata]|uniref:Uncharacterized protein n=1 Tax=Bauhinia variegata TaxID=167791 RepID=A0ACB9KUL5_BAUVA|nr:hypothetical protein L6164_034353 [Bauhinia variegata]